MELTASRMILAALPVVAMCLVGGVPTASDAQRIVSFPSAAGYETISRDRARDQFPRREELLQALDFLESYERGIQQNDWNRDQDVGGGLLYGDEADNTLDIPPWLASYLLREAQGNQEDYPPQEEEPEDLSLDLDDQELLEALLEEEEEEEEEAAEEEAVEEAYEEAMEREEQEAIADIVEQEMEDVAANDILDDIWAQEVLQEDAEKNLKWLLVEEEERLQREEEQSEEEEDPFESEFFSSEAENYPAAEPDDQSASENFGEGFTDYGAEYSMVGGSEEAGDFVGESLDDEEKEELLEEAAEILELQEMEDEEEERRKAIRARRILESVIGSLAKEAIQEEMQEEGEAAEDDEGEFEEDEDIQTSSVLDAGMGDGGSEEDVEQEVYNELVEFLENEIDQAIEDVADDILQEIDEEAEKEAEGVIEGEGVESTDEEGDGYFEGAANTEEGSQEVTSEGSEDGDECSSLQYFIDDCNIVNNYGDLGEDGYMDLFAGACNRHQLCYACGEYYDVGSTLCDELYKAEMLARCDEDDTGCRQRAKYFWLVARNNRIPDIESPPICADPCILNYMVEV
ncbi:protein Ycf2-like [Patiria miniata]|uniref:Uncharacterized protein n=1 Tax=Patiria miniata TaxID=46514 RepID=A0A913ZH38_PATMI|nr:protein Ycf2-like [Patiria miniata]XP_038051103.1 protein Ycf2-like [Patiria miniata]